MKLFGFKINIYLVIAGVALLVILSGSTTCGCMKKSPMEAMTLLANSDSFVTKYNVKKLEKIPNSHETNLKEKSGNSMLMWGNNNFSKDCCKDNQSNYYNRNGCVCATKKQVNFLMSRGNNHKCA
jgi:hypothetical protein